MESPLKDHLANAASEVALAMAALDVDGRGLRDAVVAFRALVDQVEFVCTRSVGLLRRETCRGDGYANASDWMIANTNAAAGEGARRQEQAALLLELPSWAEAVSAGTVGYIQFRMLSTAVNRKRLEYAIRDQAVLVQAAQDFSVPKFRQILAKWVSLCDDTVTVPESDDKGLSERRFQLAQTMNGMWHAEGFLDPLTGANLQAALTAAMPAPNPDDHRTFLLCFIIV